MNGCFALKGLAGGELQSEKASREESEDEKISLWQLGQTEEDRRTKANS